MPRRPRPKILALILAGGEGGRLEVLTAERARPAVPFTEVYRLIDSPLSNCPAQRDLRRLIQVIQEALFRSRAPLQVPFPGLFDL